MLLRSLGLADKGRFFKLVVGALDTILDKQDLTYLNSTALLDRIKLFSRHVFIVFKIASAKVDSFEVKELQKEHYQVLSLCASLYKSNRIDNLPGNIHYFVLIIFLI
jgi:hypothetical protein